MDTSTVLSFFQGVEESVAEGSKMLGSDIVHLNVGGTRYVDLK